MYIILIFSFITTLIVYSINATQNFSGVFNGFWSKSKIIERLPISDQKVLYAINTICENDAQYCADKNDSSGNLVFNLSDFSGYNISISAPSNAVKPHTKIIIDSEHRNLFISNMITNIQDRKIYIGKVKSNLSVSCDDGSAIPCDSALVTRKIKLKEESRNSFIDLRIAELDNIIQNGSEAERTQAIQEKNDLNDEKNNNLDIIANRKNLIP